MLHNYHPLSVYLLIHAKTIPEWSSKEINFFTAAAAVSDDAFSSHHSTSVSSSERKRYGRDCGVSST